MVYFVETFQDARLEDGSIIRKDNAPQNLALLKKIVLNMTRFDTTNKTKASLRLKRKAADWDDDLRMNTLGLSMR